MGRDHLARLWGCGRETQVRGTDSDKHVGWWLHEGALEAAHGEVPTALSPPRNLEVRSQVLRHARFEGHMDVAMPRESRAPTEQMQRVRGVHSC